MARAFAATICAKVSHAILNEQQHEKYPDAPVIVSFAPGFQLDVNAYSNMVKAFNATGIPFFVAPSLPQGKTAFAYSEHPEQLVRSLTHFTEELAANRPKTQIIALGHSY